jgi:hypothetical protein
MKYETDERGKSVHYPTYKENLDFQNASQLKKTHKLFIIERYEYLHLSLSLLG